MPDPIPRDFPDLLLDALVEILETESAWQHSSVRYHVRRGKMRPPSKSLLPLVNVWCADDEPDESKSSNESAHFTATVNVDLYARGEETFDDSSPEAADEAAVKRLEYLRAQVRHAIYKLPNADLGFGAGVLASKGWPRWQMFQVGERIPFPAEDIIGGRLSFEIEYEWTPEDIATDALSDITVSDSDLELWSAHYIYAGGET